MEVRIAARKATRRRNVCMNSGWMKPFASTLFFIPSTNVEVRTQGIVSNVLLHKHAGVTGSLGMSVRQVCHVRTKACSCHVHTISRYHLEPCYFICIVIDNANTVTVFTHTHCFAERAILALRVITSCALTRGHVFGPCLVDTLVLSATRLVELFT